MPVSSFIRRDSSEANEFFARKSATRPRTSFSASGWRFHWTPGQSLTYRVEQVTAVTEVAEGIHQLTTFVEPANFSFNQYVVTGEEPLVFHTGPRQLFPLVSDATSGK